MTRLVRIGLGAAVLLALGVGFAAARQDSVRLDERAAVAQTIRKAVRAAVMEKNYERACRFGTPTGRRRLLGGHNSSSGPDYPSCEAILRDEVEDPAHRFWIARLRDGIVVKVLWVRADNARARVDEDSEKYAAGGYVRMRRIGGRWRFDNSNLIPRGD